MKDDVVCWDKEADTEPMVKDAELVRVLAESPWERMQREVRAQMITLVDAETGEYVDDEAWEE